MIKCYPLSSPQVTMATAGGKGANLRRLLEGGFPVPPGFVLSTDAYRAFVEANNLQQQIETALAETAPTDPASYTTAATAIRAAFAAGEVPAQIGDALRAAYDELAAGAGPVAVRSSATAEDLPQASFAGQQETYLNVRGIQALEEAVRHCWSSLWTPRAIAYRARQEMADAAIALAVVVQQMVPATSAGVLFTVNPITGNAGELLINATWGLGEVLVAGQVNPDTVVVDKASGRVKAADVAPKLVMTVATDSGTVEQEVAPEQQQQPVLSPEQASRLGELGQAIERYLGAPQDVEWAIAGEEIAILQARPITTAAGVPGDDDWPPHVTVSQPFDLWTQADVGERWPEPVTPLTWSTAYPMLNENMNSSFAGIDDPTIQQIEWARRAFGRVYLNEGALAYAFHRAYGMPASLGAASMAQPQLIPAEYDRWHGPTLLRRLPLLALVTVRWERNGRRFQQDFRHIDRSVDGFMARDLTPVSDRALWQESQSFWRERLMHYMEAHAQVLSLSLTSFSTMQSFLKGTVGDENLVYELITGLEGVIAAEMVPALQSLARQAEDAGLAPLFLEQDPHEILPRLREIPAASPFLQAFDAFLQRHGHRCMTEAEWLHPRWMEEPAQLVETIAGYLRAGLPAEVNGQAKQVQRRETVTAELEAQLDPLRRAYFRSGLARLQRLMRLRDNGQHYLVKLLLPMRHIYATLGQRWATRGWLEHSQDFFFLLLPEIEAVLNAGDPDAAGLDLPSRVAARRLAYDHWFTQPAPEVLDAAGQPLAQVAVLDGQHLRGVPASSGRVEGRARVALSPQEATRLQPGEILVTRATDPGWTPLFSVIGGLVLEIGGQLSHGAIVAREYGLPAVVNVPEATRRIRDGQRVVVDGGEGVVYLPETADSSEEASPG